MKNVIRDSYTLKPFVLADPNSSSSYAQIKVEEVLAADFLDESLITTHDKFEPSQSNLLAKGLDRIFGDVSKGFQEKERLLPVGTSMLGIGKIAIEKGMKVLVPPENGMPYILTTKTKRQVIKSLQGTAHFFKVISLLLGVVGVGITGFIVYKHYMKWQQRRAARELQREVEAARQQRMQAAADRGAANNGEAGGDHSRDCVVCLTNPREVILLDCGHICVCLDCSQAIPEPKKCPVCRADIERIRSIYIP